MKELRSLVKAKKKTAEMNGTEPYKGFVLSTGRTGTVALTKVLNTCERVKALHEPSPSRRFHILSYFQQQGLLSEKVLGRYYFYCRRNLIRNFNQNSYIEVNCFIWGLSNILHQRLAGSKILHIVRDARTYIPSITNFKAKGWHKYIIDFVPFWYIKVDRIIDGIHHWETLSDLEKVAWRWVLINKTIGKNENNINYLRIRFEDIMTNDRDLQRKSLHKIKDFFKIDMDIDTCSRILKKKINFSSRKNIGSFDSFDPRYQKSILKITDSLMRKYGYC